MNRTTLLQLSVFAFVFSGSLELSAAPSAEKLILLPVSGSTSEDTEIARWQERAREPRALVAYFERLGWAFVGKARRTQDSGFYKLAEATADAMDARFGATADSRLLRAHALHNLHRFEEAEKVVRILVAERGLALDFALLSDVLMEQGKIDDAAEACQRSMNLRPGMEAYSRAAHLRWVRGDLNGAVEAMSEAVNASSSREGEAYTWALTRLSGYRLQQGQSQLAWKLADRAASVVPDYAPALLARARAELARGDIPGAVVTLKRATDLNPLPEYQWWLADALRAAGDSSGAETIETELVRRGAAADPRTLSLYLATRRTNPERAVALAREELRARGDFLTHDAMAWAQYAAGDLAAADQSMQRALAEKTKDARLFFHAGVIASARDGKSDRARAFFEQAVPMAASLTPSERVELLKCAGPANGPAASSLRASLDAR